MPASARFATRWRELAACRGTDLEVFFPGRGESAGPARQVCAACLVRELCLNYAITNRIAYGIWGGLTERERRALRSRWVRAARRERNQAILAADTDGYMAAAIGRSWSFRPTRGDAYRRTRAEVHVRDRVTLIRGWTAGGRGVDVFGVRDRLIVPGPLIRVSAGQGA